MAKALTITGTRREPVVWFVVERDEMLVYRGTVAELAGHIGWCPENDHGDNADALETLERAVDDLERSWEWVHEDDFAGDRAYYLTKHPEAVRAQYDNFLVAIDGGGR